MSCGRSFCALVAVAASLALLPASALALPKAHECQKPVRTGVEVFGLHDITAARACPPALELFTWENAGQSHAQALYGCRRPQPEAAGFPYLRLHSFRGWTLSLRSQEFTMSRGKSYFHVSGTDFPLNCT
jgi:hypothetical protein